MEYKRLGDYVRIITGKLDANANDEDGVYPFFTCSVSNLRINTYAYDCECILVAGNGDLNVKYYEGKFNAYQRTYIIESLDKSILNVRFLYYFMSKYVEILRQGSIGGVIKYIKLGDLTEAQFPILPLQTQKKIVKALDKAQALIDLRKAQIKLLDNLMQSIFYDMFGDLVTNPKCWDVIELKSLTTKILSGNTPKGGSQVYVEDGIMFFRSQNVWRNKLELEDIAYIDIKTHSRMRNSSLKYKDILMTKTGRVNTENSSLGRAAMFLREDDSANINGHVYLIRLHKSVVHEFVLFILTTDQYREYIRGVCVGGIDKRQLNKNHIEEFPIILPPIALQKEFVEKIQEIETQKNLMEKSLIEMENNYNSIIQKAFKGELFS